MLFRSHTARTHPGHVNLKHVPFASRTLNVNAPMSGSIRRTNVFVNSANQANRNARVYYTPLTQGLSYRRANGSFIDVSHANVPHGLRLFPGGRARVLAEVQLMLSPAMNEYGTFLAPGSGPRMAGPLSNAELLNNITHQIFSGRGNINATRYTNDQKQRLAAKLKNKIHTLKNKYKKQKADGVNEKIYGMARNQMLAYQRGLAAVEPLSGAVKSPRIRNETPNRWTPGSAGRENYVKLAPLKSPHIVVKRKGLTTLYLNPGSLIKYIKGGTGASIVKSNLRDWLRQMRRNNPTVPLFKHPESKNKMIRPKNIRFSK